MWKNELKIIKEQFQMADENLSGDVQLSDLEEWDSFNKLNFMDYMYNEYGAVIGIEELSSVWNVADLCALIREMITKGEGDR